MWRCIASLNGEANDLPQTLSVEVMGLLQRGLVAAHDQDQPTVECPALNCFWAAVAGRSTSTQEN